MPPSFFNLKFIMIDQYINDIKNFEPLDPELEAELIAKAQNGDRRAYERVINCNLRFVFQIAKSYQNCGLPLEDLIAEGNVGIVKAMDRFELEKGVKFISYAV